MIWVSRCLSILMEKKKTWNKVLNLEERGWSDHWIQEWGMLEYAVSMLGKVQQEETGGSKELFSKNQHKLWNRFSVDYLDFSFVVFFFCLVVLVSQVKVCTATWWFIVIFVLYFLKHDFLVKRHVFHRFYSSKCQCNCICVILTSPYSCC